MNKNIIRNTENQKIKNHKSKNYEKGKKKQNRFKIK